ncbi:glycoside hydrolase family 5 protein [Compostibacter hankyongensis]|uniref:Glycoside hydrolase family 5 protein n=1 Tax=Compostibacter hankyongensis TaxID=1007089 RepID=A0ABP8G2X3_9BACT
MLAAFPGAVVRGALPSLQRAENPRWYGFNLLELFSGFHPQPFREQDFEMMAEWKFNFARIPMSYWNWSKPDPAQWMKIDEEIFRLVDQVVDFGRQYGVHICLNLHRIPGYCVNDGDKEPLQLFSGPAKDQAKALEAATYHWQYIARRYKGTDSNRLSFDLINEPGSAIPAERYISVLQQLTRAIREIDPDRRIVVDGLEYGNLPVSDLAADKSIFQSTHGYAPMQLTHYQASWVWKDRKMPVPEWPLRLSASDVWDKERLRQHFRPWTALNRQGVPVHVGEWGVYNRTPHKVALAYMHDQLALWKSYGWGWSLWNLRGSFGILDSDRKDISYESYKGRRLDRKMLEVLLEGIKTPEHS